MEAFFLFGNNATEGPQKLNMGDIKTGLYCTAFSIFMMFLKLEGMTNQTAQSSSKYKHYVFLC